MSSSMAFIPKGLSAKHSNDFLTRLSLAVLSACERCGAEKADLPAVVKIGPAPNPKAGDFSFVVAGLVSAFGAASPDEIAMLLAKELDPALVQSTETAGRYINLRVAQAPWAYAAIKDVLGESCAPLGGEVVECFAEPQHWLVEFSSPNTNKPQHLGHVRNNLLGDACSRMLTMLGHTVTKVNLVNDRGIHICKSMMAYKKNNKGEKVAESGVCSKKGDHFVGDFYVQFEKDFQEEWIAWLSSDAGKEHYEKWQAAPKGLDIARKIKTAQEKADKETEPKAKEKILKGVPDMFESFKKSFKDHYFGNLSGIGQECSQMLEHWEAVAESETRDDDEIYKLWKQMNSWVLSGFWDTYKRMGIEFDHVDYESLTYQLGKSLCESALESGLMHKTESGAVAISYEKMPALKKKGEKVLLRSNGTSVYMTQDLGTAFMRWDKFNADHMVYVVAEEQREHFQTLFEVLALLRPEMKDRFLHMSYGMVNLTSGRMKSREGTVVDADNLMDEVRDLAASATRSKCPDLTEREIDERAEKIGLAALKFFILSASPESTMVYDPKESIKFEGKTGPYILYSYVRTRSILRKCETTGDSVVCDAGPSMSCLSSLDTVEERAIIRCLSSYNSALMTAAKALDPAKVCNALFDIAQAFNKFFKDKEKHPILECNDVAAKQARLLLTHAVGIAIKNGLALLGIETLEHM